MSDPSKSFLEIVSRLRQEFPGVKLLALGQTIYWDEPMKATLRRLLDEYYPEAVMAVGVHDADYFSKVPANLILPDGWPILPHNDGSTKDLWVATGEISRLFGSETIPSKDLLTSYGVQLDKIGRDYRGGREALIETATEAWGWRGLVHQDATNETSCCIPLKTILPHFIELLSWGFNHTIDSLAEPVASELAKLEAERMLNEVRAYYDAHPDATITRMFKSLLYKMYGRLMGYEPKNLEMTSISEIFKFNRSTADEGRFNLLRLFLDPSTQEICQDAYNQSLVGADIYTLDRFCDGAIPFDLVVPGKGRGTICLLGKHVLIDLDEPVTIPVERLPETPEELASVIEGHFGPNVALIGKAITLVLMMASEYIFLLNEQGSSYVPYCEKMAALMKAGGIDASFFPILRIDYQTWDSLSANDVVFSLPGHLASAFRQGDITSREFTDSWHSAVTEQEALLQKLADLSDTEALLGMLAGEHESPWADRLREYRAANVTIREFSERTEPLKVESLRLRDLSYQMKQDIQALELEKGAHFRREIKARRDALYVLEADGKSSSPEAEQLRREIAAEEIVREDFESRIERDRETAQETKNKSLKLKNEVRALEKGDAAQKARKVVKSVEYEAELARLWMVRDALLVTKGLPFTDHRPSAWWFLLADPELKWFNRVTETAEFRWEEIDS